MKNTLIEKLQTIEYRRFINRSLEELAIGLFLGTVGACIFALTNRLIPIPVNILYLVLIPLFLGICFGLVKTLRNRENLLDVAKFIDRVFNLDERISTAFEMNKSKIANSDVSLSFNSIEQLQIKDAERTISSIDVYSEFPYKIPSITKFIPVSLALILFSFFIPKLYDSEMIPSNLEKEAMLQTAEELEEFDRLSDIETNKVIEELRKEKPDVEEAQKELAKLNISVRKRSDILESRISKRLEKLIEQEIPPEFKNKLVKNLSDGELDKIKSTVRNLQNQIQNTEYQISNSVQKSVQKIAEQAQKIAQLREMSRVIQNGQQRIGLASLEQSIESEVSVANQGGKPGEESDNGEAIGREVGERRTGKPESRKAGKPESQQGKSRKSESQRASVSDLGKPTPDFSNNQNSLRLKGLKSESESFSLVYSPDFSVDKGQVLAEYRDVYLASKQELDEAISKGDIPVRYRKQVKEYFEGIVPIK